VVSVPLLDVQVIDFDLLAETLEAATDKSA
jgi:hypothetical protein